MLLTAQRVRSPQGIIGINIYLYRHVGLSGSSDLALQEAAAELVAQEFEVPPGGNNVRSYVDLFAPEGTGAVEIARAAAAVRSGPDPSAFPAVFREGAVTLRFGLVFGLVPSWRSELTDLVSRILLSSQESNALGLSASDARPPG